MCVTLTDCVYDERPCSYTCGTYLVCPRHLTSVHVGNVDNSNREDREEYVCQTPTKYV